VASSDAPVAPELTSWSPFESCLRKRLYAFRSQAPRASSSLISYSAMCGRLTRSIFRQCLAVTSPDEIFSSKRGHITSTRHLARRRSSFFLGRSPSEGGANSGYILSATAGLPSMSVPYHRPPTGIIRRSMIRILPSSTFNSPPYQVRTDEFQLEDSPMNVLTFL